MGRVDTHRQDKRAIGAEAGRPPGIGFAELAHVHAYERALRGIAIGRKNHYESRLERGRRTASLIYSLIESAKLCGVEPRAYPRNVTLRAVRTPGTVTFARDLKSPKFRQQDGG